MKRSNSKVMSLIKAIPIYFNLKTKKIEKNKTTTLSLRIF